MLIIAVINAEVTIGLVSCAVQDSSTYTQIVCITSASAASTDDVTVISTNEYDVQIPAECTGTCSFSYELSSTPTITDVDPTEVIYLLSGLLLYIPFRGAQHYYYYNYITL